MKKSLIMTIIIFLLVGVLGGVVNAASASARPSASSVEIGNNVTVTISFGQKVSAAKNHNQRHQTIQQHHQRTINHLQQQNPQQNLLPTRITIKTIIKKTKPQ